MIVTAKNTEQKLWDDLQRAIKSNPVQKCFYMQFSLSPIDKQGLFETFLQLLEALPKSYMAHVYLCPDKDIFITMQGFMQRQFYEFINGLATNLHTPELNDLVQVFEIGVHWNDISTICKQKLKDIDKEARHKKEAMRKTAAENFTLSVLDALDIDLINSLAHRRHDNTDVQILIVDDDKLSRTLVGNVLSNQFKIAYAQNGKEAIIEYITSAPDIMFLDIGLPDINGHDVLECIFQIDPNAYVIMFSGKKDKETIVRALQTGAQGFLGKPFTRHKLHGYVQKSPFIIHKTKGLLKPKKIADY